MGYYSYGHVCQCLSRLSTLRRDSPVTIFGNRRKTGRQFVEGVLSLSRGLSELGLRPGDVVVIAALNSDSYLEWLLAVAFVGGIAAPLNYRWSFEEARFAMEVVKPVLLVVDEFCSSWYSKLQGNNIPSIRWHVFMEFPSTLSSSRTVFTTETLKRPSSGSLSLNYLWAPEDVVLICFTSGTTGRPKGVSISHTALIIQSLAKIAIVGYNINDVYLHTTPLCHIGGVSSAMAMLMAGAFHVLIPKFEVKSVVEAIKIHQVTSLITVPTMIADLVSFIRRKETLSEAKSVKKVLNGGGGLNSELIRDATKIFPYAKLLSSYGMTETCSSLTFMTLYEPVHEKSSTSHRKIDETKFNSVSQPRGICVGKPAPHVELRISNDQSSHVGSILTRGPHLMLRYWDQIQKKVSNSKEQQCWFDTGDIGYIDDNGDLWLVGRTKDRIKSGGENVYPNEVEVVLLEHPGISNAVVVSIPNTRLIEMVSACIQIKDHWQWVDSDSVGLPTSERPKLSSDILQKFCKDKNLTGFKIPKIFILWRKPFPLTSTGKLKRDEVRREVISERQFFTSYL